MKEIAFLIFATGILGVLIWLCHKSKQRRFPVMFATTLLSLLAFYLFQFGHLSSFSLKALSAEASFISEKKQEVIQDAKAIESVKEEVEHLLNDSQSSKEKIDRVKQEILALTEQLKTTTEMASPPLLILSRKDPDTSKTDHKATFQFTPTKNVPLGIIAFVIEVISPSEARILDVWPTLGGGAVVTDNSSKRIENDGKRARLTYSLMTVGQPTFYVTLSEKGSVQIQGNHLKDSIIEDID